VRIVSVEIKDLLGTRRAEFRPGTLTVVSGSNGQGKSSIIEALKQVFTGGHDPNVLRRGAKFGEALLKLDNGTEIRMRVTAKGTTYEITDEQGNEVKSPRAYIEKLGDALAIDPSKLLLAKPKELAAVLLEVMPIQFSQEELQKATGEDVWPIARGMSLDEVDVLAKQIYDARTTANRQAKEAETTAKSLKSSLPDQDGSTDWNGRAKELRDLLQEAKQSRETEIKAIDREERDEIEAIKARAQKDTDEAKARAREKRGEIDANFEPDMAKINAAIGEAEQRARDYDRAEGIRLSIQNFEKQATKAQHESAHFSQAIEGVQELKQRKLAELPIPGLEVREGQVYADGIPFERVNLAERIKIAFQIAAMRSGQLPFMVLDQAEAMDAETWEAFKGGASQSGFQVIAARVADGPLRIEAEEKQAA